MSDVQGQRRTIAILSDGVAWVLCTASGHLVMLRRRGRRRSRKTMRGTVASPFSMSAGGETILAAGRGKDSGWGVHTILMDLE